MYGDYQAKRIHNMSYRVEPIKRRVWDDVKEEVVELPEIYGYCVRGSDGRTLSEGFSREEAMLRASEFILLPKS